MVFLRYILLFFFYSSAGWAVESTYRSLGEGRLINSGFMSGPLCPIYGFGALIMTVCLYEPFRDKPLVVFALGMLLCDALEYVTSLGMELLFNQHWWNYKYEFVNIKGRICLKHTLFWGAAAIGYTYLLHPSVDKITSGFSDKTVIIIVAAAFAVFIVDYVYTFMRALDVRSMQSKLTAFKEKVSVIVDPIKDAADTIGEKLDKSNSKINESRQDLYEQAQSLAKELEIRLGLSKREGRKKAKINQAYTNLKLRRNSIKELEWLKRLANEFSENEEGENDD